MYVYYLNSLNVSYNVDLFNDTVFYLMTNAIPSCYVGMSRYESIR